MDEAVIRAATVDDAAGIAHVHTASWREAYADLLPADYLAQRVVPAARWVSSLQNQDRTTFVAVIGPMVVGFASVAQADEEPGVGQLSAIYLLAAYWGHGLGYALHRRGMEWFERRGFAEAVLEVFTANERTRAFYRRQGWVDDGDPVTDVMGGRTVSISPLRRRLAT